MLTQAFPSGGPNPAFVVASNGDRLPYSARVSANLSVDDEFPLIGNSHGFFGLGWSYVGDRLGVFQATPNTPRGELPSYLKLDLHAGVKKGDWTISLFANNVTDKRGLLVNDQFPTVSLIQPRTIGLSASRTF